METSFKSTVNRRYKYENKKKYLDSFIDPSFPRLNKLFDLLFEINGTKYLFPTIDVKDHNVIIYGRFMIHGLIKAK